MTEAKGIGESTPASAKNFTRATLEGSYLGRLATDTWDAHRLEEGDCDAAITIAQTKAKVAVALSQAARRACRESVAKANRGLNPVNPASQALVSTVQAVNVLRSKTEEANTELTTIEERFGHCRETTLKCCAGKY